MITIPRPTFAPAPNNSIFIDGERQAVKGCVFVPPSADMPLTIPARAGATFGLSPATILESPTDSYSELLSLICLDAADVTQPEFSYLYTSISDFTDGERRLSKRPIPVRHVFGNRYNPFMLLDPKGSEPLMLRPQQVLQFNGFYNADTTQVTNFRFGAVGRRFSITRLRPDTLPKLEAIIQRRKNCYPYWIALRQNLSTTPLPGVSMAAGETADIFFEEEEDEILVTRILAHGYDATATSETYNAVMDLWDARSEKKLNNQPIILSNAAFDATNPFQLASPIVMSSNMVVRARITNNSANAVDYFISLFGVRLT